MTDDAIPEPVEAEVISLAGRRQKVETVRDEPLSRRALITINRAAEAFAAKLSINGHEVPPSFSVTPIDGTGRVSVAIIATLDVERFNAACENPILAGLDGEWRSVAVIAARLGRADHVVEVELRRLFNAGEVEHVGGLWRRRS